MSGVLHGVVAALKSAAAAATDAFFNYVTLLLPGSGTNGAQNNTFLDGSSNNFTVTRNGNTTQGTFSPYGANWSNYFDGANDRLTIADNAVLRPGTANFTIEAWIFRTAAGAAHTVYAKGGAATGFVFQVTSTDVLRFTNTTSNIDSTGTIAANTWVHVAAVREGTGSNQFKLYINGVNDGTGTVSTNFNQTEEARIGEDRSATGDFAGYISNLRFTTAALYTAGFTPSTTPLTTTSQGASASDVELLTCQSNRIIDNSSNAFTVTRNGDVTVQVFSPFSPTAAYSTSVIGGSGYFDGSGDYLSIADNAALEFGSSNFTVEFWCYWNGNTASQIFWTKGADLGSAYAPFLFWKPSGSSLVLYASSNGTSWDIAAGTTLATMDANQWSHFALVRNGNTIKFYKNGVEQTSITTSLAFWNNTQAMTIGAGAGGVYVFNSGYISDARIVVGTAVYTAAFTPPAAPLTAITNTSLLLNFTNAGVIDNAMMNDIETVGNAQISNAQAKWGSTSISFDGTGDWLLVPNAQPQQLGTANFTVEGWIRLNAINTAYGVISKGTATTGWSVNITSGNKLQFSYTATQLTGATSLAANTWYHFAVVRNGTGTGNLKIYLDGVSDATSAGAVTDNFNQTNSMYVGANRTGGEALNGYVQDARITNGVARYTANFTPPTAAFPLN